MTDEELKDIEERAKRATWWHESECGVGVAYDYADEHHEEPIYVVSKGTTIGETFIQLAHGYDNDGVDWNFIAHARADVPALIAEVRRLQTALTLLGELTDPDDCRYDHRGYCQAHNLHERPCPHERAKELAVRAGEG